MTPQEINEAVTTDKLNELVARNLGWVQCCNPKTMENGKIVDCFGWSKGGSHFHEPYPSYSTSIEAAWEIVEWLNKHEYEVELTMNPDGPDTMVQIDKKAKVKIAECDFTGDPIKDFACLFADTAPLAICLAFLELP